MKSKSLAFKLYASIGFMIVIIFASCVFSILMISKTQSYASNTGHDTIPSFHYAFEVKTDLSLLRRNELRILTAPDQKAKIEFEKILKQNRKTLEENLDKYKKYISSENEEKGFQKFKQEFDKYNQISNQIVELGEKGLIKEAQNLMFNKGDSALKDIENIADTLTKASYAEAIDSTKQGASLTFITVLVMTCVISFCILIFIAVFFIINKSTKEISEAVVQLKDQSVSTNNVASGLKNSAKTLSDASMEQTTSVHETTAAVNEITSMVHRTSENAKTSADVAKSAATKAETAQKTMERLVTAMDSIQESNSQLQNIADIIVQINEKTKVINDIVNKTELLSLNASIESARAGEHGKGFAVVADEVGKLAKVSGKSAKEIQTLIRKSKSEVSQILEATITRVTDGKRVTSEAQDSFFKIAEDIVNMSSVIQQISDASYEQQIGVKQISTAMEQIDRTTQSCQNTVNSTTDSSTLLLEQSDKLNITAKEIEVLILGDVS